jgi:hypothetical protein
VREIKNYKSDRKKPQRSRKTRKILLPKVFAVVGFATSSKVVLSFCEVFRSFHEFSSLALMIIATSIARKQFNLSISPKQLSISITLRQNHFS